MAPEISEFYSLTLAGIGDAGIPFIQTGAPLTMHRVVSSLKRRPRDAPACV